MPTNLLKKIEKARLPRRPSDSLWDVYLSDGRIDSVRPHGDVAESAFHGGDGAAVLDAQGRLLAPSLCHAHIHLDKCFLLSHPKFSDLEIVRGDFTEAMELTSQAKRRFAEDDLLCRGRRLIRQSIAAGVTHMRAFVELDGDVETRCLDAGLRLKEEFRDRCEIQICAYAQLPCFSGEDDGRRVRELMEAAAGRKGVDVVGSTPYVEADTRRMELNARWITDLALASDKYLDLHMDYNIDERETPFMFAVLGILREKGWAEKGAKGVCMGHCTRLTLFTGRRDWKALSDAVGDLPVAFVGLPTSDLFMMRSPSGVRGTLHVPDMIEWHMLNAAVAINNVGNAFTPQGDSDPLALASTCVGLYQRGTKRDAELLYETVSGRAKAIVGFEATSLSLMPGEPANFVLFEREEEDWETRRTIVETVYNPGRRHATIKDAAVI